MHPAVLTRSAYLLEGVRLEEPMTLTPLLVSQVAVERGYGGRDLREVLNQELGDAGFVTEIAPWSWGPQVAPGRRLALAVCERLETGDVHEALHAYSVLIARLTDLLALTHGGAPRAVGGVMELAQPDGTWRTLSIMAGGGASAGSSLARLASDTHTIEQLSLPQLWEQPPRDPRVGVWLSLHRGITAEPRWDVRIFRSFSLLETIATETMPADQLLIDRAGESLAGYDGKPTSSATARGRVYLLLERCLAALELADDPIRTHPEHSLWHETGIWGDVRNAVAHEGHWQPSRGAVARRHRRVIEAFERAARGGSLDSGWLRYADAAAAGGELVLRAAVVGLLARA